MSELCIDNNPAYKLFISDLVNCEKSGDVWRIRFEGDNKWRPLWQFQLQATVLKMTGFSNEILIVTDSTGKAKLTRSSKVPGEFSWLSIGCLCSIVGTLTDNGKLPQVDIVKLAKVDNQVQQEMWNLEVNELKNFLCGKITPIINSA